MLILTIRTDNPAAEIGLYQDQTKKDYLKWEAHRELSSTIHLKIQQMLTTHKKQLSDLEGLVVYKGPGSFTGLRIGMTVADTLSYALNIPIVSATTEEWIALGIERLLNKENEVIALPEYGQEPHITKQKH